MKRKIWIVVIIIGTLFMVGWRGNDYSNPRVTFETYKKALAEGNIEAYLDCLTKASQQMFSQRSLQPSLIRREYRDIAEKNYEVTLEDGTAILEFVPRSEIAPPYLFKREDGKWKLDLKRMSEEIVFDNKNRWRWR